MQGAIALSFPADYVGGDAIQYTCQR